MEAKFSPRVKDVISFSREEALRIGNDYIGVEHLLLGMIREGHGKGIRILNEFHLDLKEVRNEIEKNLTKIVSVSAEMLANIPLVKQAEKVLKITYLEAKLFRSPVIGTEHLLLSILKEEDSVACRVLNKYGVIYENVKDELETMKDQKTTPRAEFPGGAEEEGDSFATKKKSADPKSKTPVLDNFGRDLTKMAELGKLDPIVGR